MRVVMDDCKFYSSALRGRCTALTELVCREKECSFYKPRLKDETDNTREDKTKA